MGPGSLLGRDRPEPRDDQGLVEKKIKRIIGNGWDGRDPNDKKSSKKSAGRKDKSSQMSSQVSSLVKGGKPETAQQAQTFVRFSKRYIASHAARSLEENFGILGAWAASKIDPKEQRGHTDRASGSSVVSAIDDQAKSFTTGLSKLGSTLSRGTNMIARSVSLSGEKMSTALSEIEQELKKIDGDGPAGAEGPVAASALSLRSSAT